MGILQVFGWVMPWIPYIGQAVSVIRAIIGLGKAANQAERVMTKHMRVTASSGEEEKGAVERNDQ